MKRFALAFAASFLAIPAFAADLPSRYAPAPYYEPAPMFSWIGLYVGLNGQFGIGTFSGGGSSLFGSPVGGLGGATVGYNYQSGKLVVGAEADIAAGAVGDYRNFAPRATAVGTINGLGTARLRVGYTIQPNMLVYLTGGYAGAGLYGKAYDFRAAPGLIINDSHYMNGYAVGAGVEYAVTTKISVKGEYIFTGFNDTRFFAGTRDSTLVGANINLIRAGLNYHF